jgi:hypothetical protein
MKHIFLAAGISLFLLPAVGMAETTTTTTTHADGSKTVVEETTTTTPEQTQAATPSPRRIIGPAGITGTIRRSNRRQNRRQNRRNGDAHIDR